MAKGADVHDLYDVLQTVRNGASVVELGAEIGTAAGLVGMVLSRNKLVRNRSDFNDARIWDSTQFLDVVRYFAWQGADSLAHIRGQEYHAPEYKSLPTGRFKSNREKAVENLMTNPLVGRLGVRIVG
jgi:hypothetical protein